MEHIVELTKILTDGPIMTSDVAMLDVGVIIVLKFPILDK